MDICGKQKCIMTKYKTLKNKLTGKYAIWVEGECYETHIPLLLPHNVVWKNVSKDLKKPEDYMLVELKVEET